MVSSTSSYCRHSESGFTGPRPHVHHRCGNGIRGTKQVQGRLATEHSSRFGINSRVAAAATMRQARTSVRLAKCVDEQIVYNVFTGTNVPGQCSWTASDKRIQTRSQPQLPNGGVDMNS